MIDYTLFQLTSSVPSHYCVYCSKPDGSFMVTHLDGDGKCPYLKDYITHEVAIMQLTEIYKPLDPGIANVVNLLRSHGIDTFSSCEGGEEHAFPMPAIRINPESYNMIVERHKIAKILSEAGYSGYYIKCCYPYQGDTLPWDWIDQHFIEIEFWTSPVEREENND